MTQHNTNVWLINTGWSGGAYGVGQRIKLSYTRRIIDAINSGEMVRASGSVDPVFGFEVPGSCPEVPDEILDPKITWADKGAFDETAHKLAGLFRDNFKE